VALLVATRFVGSKRVRSGIGRRRKQDVLLLKALVLTIAPEGFSPAPA
jgi:hypothetical protein